MTQPLPYDPDFDKPKNLKDIGSQFPPKTIFLFGVIAAILLLSTIGFFILLAIFLKGNAGSVAAAPTTRVASPPAEQVAPPREIALRPIDNADHIRGAKNASITVVEYSDTECPFCKRFHPTMQRLVKEYDGKVRWVYRHFPLRSLHSKAAKEAEATECANEQGKFWEYLDKIFEATPSNDGLDPAQLPLLAEQIGLNRSKFDACLNSGKYANNVSRDEQDAVSAGAQGTPYSVILTSDGKKVPVSGAVPYEQMKSILDPLVQ